MVADDDQGGPPPVSGIQCSPLDELAALPVHAGRGLVQKQDPGLQDQPGGQGDPLGLASGRASPVFPASLIERLMPSRLQFLSFRTPVAINTAEERIVPLTCPFSERCPGGGRTVLLLNKPLWLKRTNFNQFG